MSASAQRTASASTPAPVSSSPLETAPALAGPAHQLDVLPGSLSGAEWMLQASEIATRCAAHSDIELFDCRSSPVQIVFRFRASGSSRAPMALIALAVPAGSVTTATLDELELAPQEILPLIPDSDVDAAPRPASQLLVEPVGYIRNTRVARVQIPLVTSVPSARRISSGVARIFFTTPLNPASPDPAWAEAQTTGTLRRVLEKLVANPQDITKFAVQSPDAIPGDESFPLWRPGRIASASFWLKAPVSKDSLYRISGADLESSGVPIAQIQPSQLHLCLNGQEEPLHHIPAGDASALTISRDDMFVFYGTANKSLYSAVNCYWLCFDPSRFPKPMPVAQQPTDLTTAPAENAIVFHDIMTVEKDNEVLTRNDQFLSILGFRWVWEKLKPGRPFVTKFNMPGIAARSEELPTTISLYIHSWPQGRQVAARLRINDGAPIEFPIVNESDGTRIFTVPSGQLRPADNVLSVELMDEVTTDPAAAAARAAEMDVWFDKLQIRYPRFYTASRDGLDFISPSNVLATARQTVPPPRVVDYRVSGITAGLKPLLFDVTNSAPLLVKYDLAQQGTADDTRILRFRAREEGIHSYTLMPPNRIPPAELQPVTPGPGLIGNSNQADYIIIVYPDFMESIRPFADRMTSAGHVVRVVPVDDIYDQFSCGQITPFAIRSFLRHAAAKWRGTAREPAASFVLLVGDATSDYRDELREFRNGVINYVPTYSSQGSSAADRFASDNWHTYLFGNDCLSDSFIGRFSVNNIRDLDAIIAKQAAYRTQSPPGPWRNTLAFVADHSEFENAVAGLMRETVPPRFFMRRIFLSEQPWIDNYYIPSEIAESKRSKVSPVTTRMIRDMINSGTAVLTYFGHGSPNIWSNERIWFGGDSENSDNLMLTNFDRLPFIINMTCNSGAIDYPKPRWNVSISEDFMRVPNGGAIACYVPSGPGITAQHEKLTRELNLALFGERIEPLGAAIKLAEWRYLMNGNPPELPKMFILLGDPDLRLVLPPPADKATADDVSGPDDTQRAIAISGSAAAHGAAGQYIAINPVFALSDITSASAGSGSALTLPVPTAADGRFPWSRAAIQTGLNENQSARSLAMPLYENSPVSLSSWRVATSETLADHLPARILMFLKNDTEMPVRNARLELTEPAGKTVAQSEAVNFLPHEIRQLTVTLSLSGGLHRLNARIVLPGLPHPLPAAPKPVVIAVPADLEPPTQPPVVIDKDSISVTYARNGMSMNARIGFDIYNVSKSGIRDLRVLLAEADMAGERVIEGTEQSIPPLAPGATVRAELRREYTTVPQTETINIDLVRNQPEGQTRWPGAQVALGAKYLPDLAIIPESIKASKTRPMDGETVFFDIGVRNLGASVAEGVRVEAFEGEVIQEKRFESHLGLPRQTFNLDPGASATVRVRWDPFHNSGPREVLLRAWSNNHNTEIRTENNKATLALKVAEKFKLSGAGIYVPPPTQDDIHARQIRIIARVRNSGESPAYGVKVVFYPTENQQNPKDALGEVILDEAPADSTREAVLLYKLKPGEESRVFKFSFMIFLKGSLQRIQWRGTN
ncbi:MAG: C25 family cysteine peptidase [Candidatus Sumerlaeota bacterium]|nr:C25 family cysteine peptidase [Candidatus Sumerlaeota bacterium]